MIGESIGGRYEVTSRLGSGGTASVWRARDRVTGRDVAVKLLDVDRLSSPEAVTRFEREARLLERLHSPNVVELYESGELDGRPYLVFELVEGEDLRERLRRDGRLPPAEAVAVVEQIANGLAAAHAAGAIHRDLKPANVLVTPSGRAKLADFGIARALEEPGLTQPGRVLGTGEYVSPEQALGRQVDARSDVYAAGVLLYELLCGRPPFRGAGFAEVATKHVRSPPPDLAATLPDAPPALTALVASCLSKSPADRPADAGALRAALRAVLVDLAGADGATGDSPVIVLALDDADDAPEAVAPPLAAIRPVGRARTPPLDELAPWEDLTPPSLQHGDRVDGGNRARPFESRPYRVPSSARRDAGALRWVAVLALGVALLAGVAIWTIANRASSGSPSIRSTAAASSASTAKPPTTAAPTTRPVAVLRALPVATVATFDPNGDGAENDAQAPAAIDGVATTSWESEIYHGTTDLTNGKGGIGLILQLAATGRARALDLTTPAPGFVVSLYTSPFATAPTSLDAWTPALGPTPVTASRQRLKLPAAARGRFVLLWFTKLAPASNGKDSSVRIAEVKVLS